MSTLPVGVGGTLVTLGLMTAIFGPKWREQWNAVADPVPDLLLLLFWRTGKRHGIGRTVVIPFMAVGVVAKVGYYGPDLCPVLKRAAHAPVMGFLVLVV